MRLLIASLLLPVSLLPAQTGHWEGSIQLPNKEVPVVVDLVKSGAGELAGAFSSPAQNLSGFPLVNVTMQGNSLSFQIRGGTPGERAFHGTIAEDGQSISGDYTQAGYPLRFSLTRTGDPKIEPPVKSAPIGKELEGVWNGALNGSVRLVLTLSNQPDGSATGNILNVDEGLEIPIRTITQKDSSLVLDLKAIGGTYSGVLSAERTELAGAFTDKSANLPLTFRRAEAKK